MNLLSLIESKRDGQPLTAIEIREFVSTVVAGKTPDYQMAAFLMAVFFRGLNTAETTALTLAMRDSGDVLKFPKDKRPLVDKHSTGGVGDKVSLPLAPLLACLGLRVPMISGRGLGITGGTLDKLDSIPGFNTLLPTERIVEVVQKVGCVICGQTDRMVPADKKLYALRDVTATVPSIPLIVSSILSKKLAGSLDALVLDVKFGAAAFMKTKEQARELAQTMVALGNECGVNTRALLTSMDAPLGRSAGNWLEVKEAVVVLETPHPDSVHPLHESRSSGRESAPSAPVRIQSRLTSAATVQGFNARMSSESSLPVRREEGLGEGQSKKRSSSPRPSPRLCGGEGVINDLHSLVLTCAAHLLVQTGKAKSLDMALTQVQECLASGAPRKKWDEMLAAQGADLEAFNRRLALDHTAPVVKELKATQTGFVSRCDARIIGELIRDLGGGRLTKESVINHEVGVDQLAKPGEEVKAGSILARLHAAGTSQADAALARLQTAFEISDQPPDLPPLIQDTVLP